MAIEDNKLNIKVGMNTRGFQKGMKTVQGGFKRLNGAIGAFTAGFVGTQVFGVVKGLATIAGEAEKTELRFKRVFGNMSTSVSVFSSKLATDLGRVETDVKSGMVSFQAFFQGLGFGGKEAAGMSAKMQALTFDLASFFNIQDENAQKRFLAALAGSPEVLDQFGINLKQAALQVELYNMGITSTVQNTDELTKTQGRLNIIMRAMQSNGILGDAQRTMNTWDNTVKRTFASLKTMGIAIGDFILPALKGFLEAVLLVSSAVNDLLGLSKKETELNQEKKSEYEQLTRILLSTKKGTNSFKGALQDLTSKYPDFWKNIDATKISHEELAKAVEKSTKQFDIQDNILKKKTATEEETRNVIKLRKELDNYNKSIDDFKKSSLRKGETTTSQMLGGLPVKTTTKDETIGEREDALTKMRSIRDAIDQELTAAIHNQTIAQSVFNGELDKTTLTYEQMFRLVSEGTKTIDADDGNAAAALAAQNRILAAIKARYALLKFIRGLEGQSVSDLRDQLFPLQQMVRKYEDLTEAGGDYELQLQNARKMVMELQRAILNANLTLPLDIEIEVPDIDEDSVKDGLIRVIDILRPITDAMSQLWTQMLTPPDGTISKEEQKEKTMAAFGGIMVGLGQALFSLGMGALLANEGLKRALNGDVGAAIAMMAVGSGLIAFGKGKMQKAKDMASARTAGGGANSGSGTGNFTGMMEAIQGEQVFRLAGNDLVTALNRTNNFQGAIGG